MVVIGKLRGQHKGFIRTQDLLFLPGSARVVDGALDAIGHVSGFNRPTAQDKYKDEKIA